ncbi:hypothetical protein IF1G_11395 [Cordyceps javanica]|uniref:Uncharacterized protein n=1 Tax=Cordyceps javanica TaxID=43265 RepID=A0A545UKF1_9HYPO|nr:hypothetical protein IF1G_11395 [Cordyceps javanica]
MRDQKTHVALHCRATSTDEKEAMYIGTESFEYNIRNDDDFVINAFKKPIPVRTSLMSDGDNTSARVGYLVDDGVVSWYILNGEQKIVYLDPTKFYTIGEGDESYLSFWHPIEQRPYRAVFVGNERPTPHSPNPEPTNLEANMMNLSLEQSWVHVTAKMGGDMRSPLHFETSDGDVVKTGWGLWELVNGAYRFQPTSGRRLGHEFWAEALPAEVVEVWVKESSNKPIRFTNMAGELIKTKRERWIPGLDDTFFVYLYEAKFYMAWSLPEGGGDGGTAAKTGDGDA